MYDPCRPNDRLLLGMKGTISEFELGILRSRMTEALWAKAKRGELRIGVPVGFIWDREDAVAFDPDIRLQEAIRLVFSKFRELGSARQVFVWMTAERLHFPRPSDRKCSTAFEWRKIRYRNVISLLKNPFYAGVYAYGKSSNETEIVDGRARKKYGCGLPFDEWRIVIKDHHTGYITWDEYEKNQEMLARNSYGRAGGSSKSGRGGGALLSGLLRCRRCGHILSVAYTGKTPAPKYRCFKERELTGGPWCIAFAASVVDRVVAAELLQAVQPLAMEAAMAAERELEREHDSAQSLRKLELQQARYEAGLAERRYAACDPDNRMVASQLEARWEACMCRVAELERAIAVGHVAEGRPAPTDDLRGLAEDLEAAWNVDGVTMRTRQRLLRALVEEIVVDVDESAGDVVLTIHWKGGQHSRVSTHKPTTGEHTRRAPEEALSVIRTMAGRWPEDQIAATLNRMGLRTGQGNTWNEKRVAAVRRTHDIKAYKSADKGGQWLTMSEAAARLGVGNGVIRRLIRSKVLPAEQVVPRAPYQIRAADLELQVVTRAIKSSDRSPCSNSRDDKTIAIPGI
jgi:excisionase family DNA binding protein